MSSEPLPQLRVVYTSELSTEKIAMREKETYEEMQDYNKLVDAEPTYERIEIRFAEDVKVLKEAVCERLRDILHNGNIVQTDNEIKQLIEELEGKQ